MIAVKKSVIVPGNKECAGSDPHQSIHYKCNRYGNAISDISATIIT